MKNTRKNYNPYFNKVLSDPIHKYSFSAASSLTSVFCIDFIWIVITIIIIAAHNNLKHFFWTFIIDILIFAIYNYFSIKKIYEIAVVIKKGDAFSGEIIGVHKNYNSSKYRVDNYSYTLIVKYAKRHTVESPYYLENPCYWLSNLRCKVYIYHGKCFVTDFNLRGENEPFTDIPEK